MARFLVDEDVPWSLALMLRAARLVAEDVHDLGLGGHPDDSTRGGGRAQQDYFHIELTDALTTSIPRGSL
jgi:hypothetical protein